MKRGSLKQRSKGTWTLTIELTRDPLTGKRRQTYETFKGTKKEAGTRLTELLNQMDKGLTIPKGKLTVKDWLTHWLETDVKPSKAVKTYDRYSGVANKHLIPHIGNIRLAALEPAHVKALLAKLSEQSMAPAGVDLCRNVLSGALKAAVRQEYLARNVIKATESPKIDQEEVQPPNIAGVAAVLDLAERTSHPLFPALHLLAYTGARRGEILALDWAHVDLQGGSIAITRSLGRARNGLVFGKPKTEKARRVIGLDERTVEILRIHHGGQMLQKLQAEDAYEDKGLVFADALGRPLNPMLITRAFQSLAKQCGLPHIKLHALRHFHASVLISQKQSLFSVSRRLGHASIQITADLYGHMLPGDDKEQAAAFAKAMRPRAVDSV